MKFNEGLQFMSILLLTLIVSIQMVGALKCWNCRSDTDPKCADPFDNSTQVMADCDQADPLQHLPGVKATMCRKIRQKVHGQWRYIRSCAFMGEPGIEGDERFCLMRTGSYNIFIEYCTCNSKDGCNLASSNRLTHPVLIFIGSMLTLITACLLKH